MTKDQEIADWVEDTHADMRCAAKHFGLWETQIFDALLRVARREMDERH